MPTLCNRGAVRANAFCYFKFRHPSRPMRSSRKCLGEWKLKLDFKTASFLLQCGWQNDVFETAEEIAGDLTIVWAKTSHGLPREDVVFK